MTRETLPSSLFPQPPVIRFTPENDVCQICGDWRAVQKTRCKTVLSLLGPFVAHETVRQCQNCQSTGGSEALLNLVPARCNVAYDVLVYVGRALFKRHRTSDEVSAELRTRNVHISASEIAWLGRKFITTLAMAHRLAKPRLQQTMRLAGGYILHLDATHDGDAPALMTGLDGISSIVLDNIKLPSEHSDFIIPFLQKLMADYVPPCACVHDMGLGICKAVTEVFPGIPDFVCHFHFLRDIGKDFLEPAYAKLRKILRSFAASSRLHAIAREARQAISTQDSLDPAALAHCISDDTVIDCPNLLSHVLAYTLSLWVLQGKHCGDGYGFPFDRPLLTFAERLLALASHLPQLMEQPQYANCPDSHPLSKLRREALTATKDQSLHSVVEELLWRGQFFDQLRNAMRIALPADGNGLNDEGSTSDLSSIRQGVEQFRHKLDDDSVLSADPLCKKMAQQIDKYGDKLFADPIEVDSPHGKISIYPQRTNNIMEQFFRDVRRQHRRKTGNDSMCRTLQTMLADTPLVKNLDNPAYMEVLLDGKKSLEELFAGLAAMPGHDTKDYQTDSGKILPGFRGLITQPTLLEKLARVVSIQPATTESN